MRRRETEEIDWRAQVATGGGGVHWRHQEIEVTYGKCLGNERKTISERGGMRLRRLVETATSETGGKWR